MRQTNPIRRLGDPRARPGRAKQTQSADLAVRRRDPAAPNKPNLRTWQSEAATRPRQTNPICGPGNPKPRASRVKQTQSADLATRKREPVAPNKPNYRASWPDNEDLSRRQKPMGSGEPALRAAEQMGVWARARGKMEAHSLPDWARKRFNFASVWDRMAGRCVWGPCVHSASESRLHDGQVCVEGSERSK